MEIYGLRITHYVLRKFIRLLGLIVVVGLAACGGPGPANSGPAAETGDIRIELQTDPQPPRVGMVGITISLTDSGGKPVDDAKVKLLSSMTSNNQTVGGLTSELIAQGNGRYTTQIRMSLSGEWLLTTEIRRSGKDVIRRDFRLEVP